MTRGSNNRNNYKGRQSSNSGRSSSNYNNKKKKKLHPLGTVAYINAYHPYNPTLVYMCEARVIRTPKRNDEKEKYKFVITGVQGFRQQDTSTWLKQLIGVKVVRTSSGFTTSAQNNWQDTEWSRLPEETATALVNRTVRNIRKEFINQKKNRTIPRLD